MLSRRMEDAGVTSRLLELVYGIRLRFPGNIVILHQLRNAPRSFYNTTVGIEADYDIQYSVW